MKPLLDAPSQTDQFGTHIDDPHQRVYQAVEITANRIVERFRMQDVKVRQADLGSRTFVGSSKS